MMGIVGFLETKQMLQPNWTHQVAIRLVKLKGSVRRGRGGGVQTEVTKTQTYTHNKTQIQTRYNQHAANLQGAVLEQLEKDVYI